MKKGAAYICVNMIFVTIQTPLTFILTWKLYKLVNCMSHYISVSHVPYYVNRLFCKCVPFWLKCYRWTGRKRIQLVQNGTKLDVVRTVSGIDSNSSGVCPNVVQNTVYIRPDAVWTCAWPVNSLTDIVHTVSVPSLEKLLEMADIISIYQNIDSLLSIHRYHV